MAQFCRVKVFSASIIKIFFMTAALLIQYIYIRRKISRPLPDNYNLLFKRLLEFSVSTKPNFGFAAVNQSQAEKILVKAVLAYLSSFISHNYAVFLLKLLLK